MDLTSFIYPAPEAVPLSDTDMSSTEPSSAACVPKRPREEATSHSEEESTKAAKISKISKIPKIATEGEDKVQVQGEEPEWKSSISSGINPFDVSFYTNKDVSTVDPEDKVQVAVEIKADASRRVATETPSLIVFCLDASGSMCNDVEYVKMSVNGALRAIRKASVSNFTPQPVEVAVVTFASRVKTLLEPTDNIDAVAESLKGYQADGNTMGYEAVVHCLDLAHGAMKRKTYAGAAIVLLTDGEFSTEANKSLVFDKIAAMHHQTAEGFVPTISCVIYGKNLQTSEHLYDMCYATHGSLLPLDKFLSESYSDVDDSAPSDVDDSTPGDVDASSTAVDSCTTVADAAAAVSSTAPRNSTVFDACGGLDCSLTASASTTYMKGGRGYVPVNISVGAPSSVRKTNLLSASAAFADSDMAFVSESHVKRMMSALTGFFAYVAGQVMYPVSRFGVIQVSLSTRCGDDKGVGAQYIGETMCGIAVGDTKYLAFEAVAKDVVKILSFPAGLDLTFRRVDEPQCASVTNKYCVAPKVDPVVVANARAIVESKKVLDAIHAARGEAFEEVRKVNAKSLESISSLLREISLVESDSGASNESMSLLSASRYRVSLISSSLSDSLNSSTSSHKSAELTASMGLTAAMSALDIANSRNSTKYIDSALNPTTARKSALKSKATDGSESGKKNVLINSAQNVFYDPVSDPVSDPRLLLSSSCSGL